MLTRHSLHLTCSMALLYKGLPACFPKLSLPHGNHINFHSVVWQTFLDKHVINTSVSYLLIGSIVYVPHLKSVPRKTVKIPEQDVPARMIIKWRPCERGCDSVFGRPSNAKQFRDQLTTYLKLSLAFSTNDFHHASLVKELQFGQQGSHRRRWTSLRILQGCTSHFQNKLFWTLLFRTSPRHIQASSEVVQNRRSRLSNQCLHVLLRNHINFSSIKPHSGPARILTSPASVSNKNT